MPMKTAPRWCLLLKTMILMCAILFPIGCAHTPQPSPRAAQPAVTVQNRINLEPQLEHEPPPAPSPRMLMALARLLSDQGKLGEAQLVLGSAIQLHPGHAPAYNELASLLVRQRQFEAALHVFDQGLKQLPNDPVLLNNAGMCYLLMQNYPKAAEALAKASAAWPQDSRCRANLALALGMAGREEEAIAIYQQILPAAEVRHNLSIIQEARHGKGERPSVAPPVELIQ